MNILIVLAFVVMCATFAIILNVRFMTRAMQKIGTPSPEDFHVAKSSKSKSSILTKLQPKHMTSHDSKPHSVAGLSCAVHGGPPDEIADEMIYWRDIPSDSEYQSPYANYGPKVKYLTVEPDEGFWNNKRMAIETAIVLAVATGRILVLPPKQDLIYDEIFHFESVAKENVLQVISTEEFLKREGLTGNLKDEEGNVLYPPENKRVNWDGDMRLWWDGNVLWPYLRKVSKKIMWEKDRCVAVIPDKPGSEGEARIHEYKNQITQERMHELIRIEGYTGNPTPVDAPPLTRLREMLATRKNVCVYNEEMQNAKYLHAMGDNQSGARMFSHFYALLFFEDWRQDLLLKRFVRDHFRYADDLQCAAARIVNEVRELAKQNGSQNGEFDSFHVRRGDFLAFQKGSQVDGAQIYKNTRSILDERSVLYIATDERDKKFFDPLSEHHTVFFLDDFQHLLGGIPMAKFGMLDQLVASRGHIFVGLYYSTFTGYINRMRAYHTQKEKSLGYMDGILPSYFYAERRFKFWLRQYRSLSWPTWKTEFPIAWRDIDHDVLDKDMIS